MTTYGELKEQFDSAMMNLEDETARNIVELTIKGEWEHLDGELNIYPMRALRHSQDRETYFATDADSIMGCIVDMVRDMTETRKREGK